MIAEYLTRRDAEIYASELTQFYGPDVHFDLSQTAESHIRLNRGHAETMFRVRVDDLTPQRTYYYWVTSMGADGESDGVQSPLSQFTTPAPGERIVAYPQPK
jgi:hypothetical protein